MECNVLWSKILEHLKAELPTVSYQAWFEDSKLYDLKNGVATIIVQYAIHKAHIKTHYSTLLKDCFNKELNSIVDLEFLLQDDLIKEPPIEAPPERTTEVGDEYINSNLKSKYTFDSFIVGNSNKLAYAAALAVAEQPGQTYNPLFLYGNSGLGKTHLMYAIGNHIKKHTDKKVLYVTSEQFVADFIGIHHKDETGTNFNYINLFKNKYRNIDVLLIDDIQYLGSATETQKEFFHTFNILHEDNKQIIISSDKSPNDLKLFEDRLKTRFCWGLTVDIYPPDFELRIAILNKRIQGEAINKEIPDTVIQYMASTLGSDVRQLEGAVTRLVAYSTIMGSEIDLDLAVEALKDYINKGYSEKNNVRRIQKVVSEHFKVSIEDLKSKKRNANLAFPRQIAMYLCRQLTEESFPKIGIEFGGKDHSTVMHAVEKIEKESKNNPELANTLEKLEKEIR